MSRKTNKSAHSRVIGPPFRERWQHGTPVGHPPVEPIVDNSPMGLDTLFKVRFRGAVSIRGYRYQILYSVLRGCDLYDTAAPSAVRLEGIEDIDILQSSNSPELTYLDAGDEFIQVKSSETSWNWSKLKDPLAGFLAVLRAGRECRFLLVVDFPLRNDIARLAALETLPTRERNTIRDNFRRLCQQIGATLNEADALLSKLTIVSLPEAELRRQLRTKIAEVFELGSTAVDVYLLALVATFLDWAKERRSVTRQDLDTVRVRIGEALSQETVYQAVGRGLISNVKWTQDAMPSDFYEGKGTRSGHIAAALDVHRPMWTAKLEQALITTGVCILRASSGQGKSTLLYRYARDNWPQENTYLLKVAESREQVHTICNYLAFRAGLGIPLLLLIDNASWQTRLWSLVAQECAALGVRVLVTTRNEDWFRFARQNLTSYEIIEPSLDLDEAKALFRVLNAKGKVHASIRSAERAYEQTGEPHLLMEYVYLLTHGRMLEERLRDQIRQITEQQEDPAKLQILRRTALADTLGVPVQTSKLLEGVTLRDDAQQVVNSLVGEYLTIEGEFLTGLHRVRSNHLFRLLHEGYPSITETALATLQAIPSKYVASYVANTGDEEIGLDMNTFIDGLAAQSADADISTILRYTEGIFASGEHQYFRANKQLFDEAYEVAGPAGVQIFDSDFLPVHKVNVISSLAEALGEKAGNLRRFKEIASRATDGPRGLDLCREYLERIADRVDPTFLAPNSSLAGKLLDWCSLCGVKLPFWEAIHPMLLAPDRLFGLQLLDLCDVLQGVYKYDKNTYEQWFAQNSGQLISYLKLHTDSLKLDIQDDIVSIEFFPQSGNSNSPNEQAVTRLQRLRSALPFCKRYRSQGLWLLPLGLAPSVDNTHKDIPAESLPFVSDIAKNVVWAKLVAFHYIPDNYYEFEESWHGVRVDALRFVESLCRGLKRILVGRAFNFQQAWQEGQLLMKLQERLQNVPTIALPSQETDDTFRNSLPHGLEAILRDKAPSEWSTSFQNFFRQLIQHLQDSNTAVGRSAVFNFHEAVQQLPEMHSAFERLYIVAPDYFNSKELDAQESKLYPLLADLLDVWIIDPPNVKPTDIVEYIHASKEQTTQSFIKRLSTLLAPLEAAGFSFVLPNDILRNRGVRYLPLAFSVSDPCHPEKTLETLLGIILKDKEIADIFCLVPTYDGGRLFLGGYQISSKLLTAYAAGDFQSWEALNPVAFTENIWSALPEVPLRVHFKQQIRASVLGLIFEAQGLAQKESLTKQLEGSESRFEQQLYQQYGVQLQELRRSISESASTLKVQLLQKLPDLVGTTYFETIIVFVGRLAEMSLANPPDPAEDAPEINDQMIEDIIRNLDLVLHSSAFPD